MILILDEARKELDRALERLRRLLAGKPLLDLVPVPQDSPPPPRFADRERLGF